MTVPLMGWSFAPLVAQWCIEDAIDHPALHPELRLAHRDLAPGFFDGGGPQSDILHYAYLDDFGGLALVERVERDAGTTHVRAVGEDVAGDLREGGLVVHKEQTGLPLEALGMVFREEPGPDGQLETILLPRPEKLWLLCETSNYLVDAGAASARMLAGVVSAWTWAFLCNRQHLSIFAAVYRFISAFAHCPGKVVKLWDSARSELAVASALASGVRACLSAEWSQDVHCVDAGPEYGAVVYCSAPQAEVRCEGRLGERSGWAVFHKAAECSGDRPRPPPVGIQWGPAREWKLACARRWSSPDHNNVGELRVAVMAIERAARKADNWGRRCLFLSDSLVAIGVLAKGRSSSPGLLRCARYALSVLATTGIRIALRYVPTWLNCADGPSRGLSFPGIHPETVRKAAARLRAKYPDRDLPQSLLDVLGLFGASVYDGAADPSTPSGLAKLATPEPRALSL